MSNTTQCRSRKTMQRLNHPRKKRYKIRAEFWDGWDPITRQVRVPILVQTIVYYIPAYSIKDALMSVERLVDKIRSPNIYEQVKFSKPRKLTW